MNSLSLRVLAFAAIAGAVSASAQTVNNVINLSARGTVGPDSGNLTTGFIVDGAAPKTVLVRGVGPALGSFGVANASTDVAITVFDQNNNVVASNDGYLTGANSDTVAADATAVGAFPLTQAGDSALVLTLAPGSYSVQASPGASASTDGAALIEVYDADSVAGSGGSTLIANFSAIGAVGQGAGSLQLGFVLSGGSEQNILLQGVGPDLASYGIGNAAGAVGVAIYDGNGNFIQSNNGFMNAGDASTMQSLSASLTGMPLTDPSDSAMLVSLNPGSYTVTVSAPTAAPTSVALVQGYTVDSLAQ